MTIPTLEEVDRALEKMAGEPPVPLAWIVDQHEVLRDMVCAAAGGGVTVASVAAKDRVRDGVASRDRNWGGAAMSCPFYGKFAGVATGDIVPQGGNQCAIIVRSHSPCVMETSLGMEPDAKTCELLSAAGLLREVYATYAERAQAAHAGKVAKAPEGS